MMNMMNIKMWKPEVETLPREELGKRTVKKLTGNG